MQQTIDGAAFRRMVRSAAAALALQKQPINELNVFPVPDGDTGTNMSLTMNTASSDLQRDAHLTLGEYASITASALLRGARGNSGVILSLLFRGFARHMKGFEEANGADFAAALTAGVEAAYKAVMKPAEGTILTVSRVAAATASAKAADDNSIQFVLEQLVESARAALAETTNQNPTLKKAGVVDAGGMGFVVILEGMLSSLNGQDIEYSEPAAAKAHADFTEFDTADITFAYDTVFIVRKAREDVDLEPLRAYLMSIGDSLVIGEDDASFKVHVHTNTPGDALTKAQDYGTLELAKIENMRTQHDDLAAGRHVQSTDDLEAPAAPAPVVPAQKRYGIVAVCAGSGIANTFRDLGADQLVEGGQTMNPSTQDILTAINATPSEIVLVLPNNKNIIMAAEQAAPLSPKQVLVLPTKTIPQGMTALLNFDPEQEPDANMQAMREAIANVSTMQMTYAARDSEFEGEPIHAGDYMTLVDGKLTQTGPDSYALLTALAQQAAADGRTFITIFYGCDIGESDARLASGIFSAACPDAEISLISGGQPVYYYLISAE